MYQFGAGIFLVTLGLINIIVAIVRDGDDSKDMEKDGELYYVYGDRIVYLVL